MFRSDLHDDSDLPSNPASINSSFTCSWLFLVLLATGSRVKLTKIFLTPVIYFNVDFFTVSDSEYQSSCP